MSEQGDVGKQGFAHRRPVLLAVVVGLVMLIAGTAIGMTGGVPQEDLDREQDRAAALQTKLTTASEQLDTTRKKLTSAEAEVKRLSAKGQVPNYVGDDVDEVQEDTVVSDYDWKVVTEQRISDRTPGTVISQSPKDGTTLARGQSLRLIVAKKAPPKPRQWVTIFSVSGAGEKRTDEFTVPDGLKVRIKYSFQGDTNAILGLEDPDDELNSQPLLNEIGDYADTTRVYNAAGRRYLEIQGGTWTVQVQVFKRPQ